jgi:thiamine pyrophosphokinase
VRQHYENHGVPILYDPDQYATDFTKCLKYLRSKAGEIVKKDASLSPKGGKQKKSVRLDVLVLGGLGGRVDQAFSQIHHLYAMTREIQQEGEQGREEEQHEEHEEEQEENRDHTKKQQNLYLISEESISFVLHAGKNTILTPGTNRPGVSVSASATASKANPAPPEPLLPSHQAVPEEESTMPSSCDYHDSYLEENIGIIPLAGPSEITIRGFEWDVTKWKTEIGGRISTSNHIRADVVSVETDRPVLFTVELAARFKFKE